MNASWKIKFRMLNHPLYMSQSMKGLKEYAYVEIKIHHPPQIHDTKYNKINESIYHKDTTIHRKGYKHPS